MLRSLNTAVSGMRQFQDEMDVIGNNIANVNTTGYKAARVQFADTFSQTLRAASPAFGSNSSVPSMQIGSGVGVSTIQNLNTQGTITRTGVDTDLAVSGQGFFVVRDTVSSANYATRAGDFRTDGNGYLVTPSGHRLQGYSDSGLSTVGDLKVDAAGRLDANNKPLSVSSFNFGSDGRLTVHLSDGSSVIRGQVLLQSFKDPAALVKQGGNLYSGLDVAGQLDWSSGAGVPSSTGPGTIQAGSLELSNVDLANEFTTLITTQRAFQASARMITTSDELLQEVVNLKR
jgi:flagellar hook protein FlgE